MSYRSDLRLIQPAAWSFLIGSALMGGAIAVPWTLLPLYLERLAMSKAEIGSVQAAEAWGQVLVALPAAVLLARRRTPPLLVASCIGTAFGYFLLPWLASALSMQACKVFIGFSWWLHYVAIAPFLFRHSTAAERPVLFGLSDAAHTASGVLGCFLCGKAAAWLVQAGMAEVRSLAWVLSAAGFLPLVAVFFYGRIREGAPPPVEDPHLWGTLRRHRGLFLRFLVPQAIVGFGAALCISFLGLYFQDRFDRPPETVGELYAAWQGLATVGFLLVPILVRRLGFVWSMVAVELASIPFFLILAFTHNYPLAVLAFLMRGALMNSSHPVLKNFMMEASPPGAREVQVALNSTAWGIAWVAGPRIGGEILDRTGDSYAVLMLTTVAFYLMASVCTVVLLGPLDPGRDRARAAVAPGGEGA